METIDIILLAPLLWGGYRGFQKGFLMEIIMVLAFVLAIIGGLRLLQEGIMLLKTHFQIDDRLLPYLAFLLIFLAIVLLVTLLGRLVKSALDLTLLGSVDNFAGALLGVVKWAFGLSALLWVSTAFGVGFPEQWTQNAVVFPFLLHLAPNVSEYIAYLVPFTDGVFETVRELLSPPAH